MLTKSKAIILSIIKYGDNKLIIRAFTENHGLISFIISRSKKGKIKTNLFYPLSILELDLKLQRNEKFSSVSDASPAAVLHDLGNNIIKTSISFFITEVLNRCIKEEEQNKNKFDFIYNSIRFLDLLHHNVHNFHLYFLLELTKYLGFYPSGKPETHNNFFDLREGIFTIENHSAYTLNKDGSEVFYDLMQVNANNFLEYNNDFNERKYLLEKLLLYYELHINNFGTIKSLEVLEVVLA